MRIQQSLDARSSELQFLESSNQIVGQRRHIQRFLSDLLPRTRPGKKGYQGWDFIFELLKLIYVPAGRPYIQEEGHTHSILPIILSSLEFQHPEDIQANRTIRPQFALRISNTSSNAMSSPSISDSTTSQAIHSQHYEPSPRVTRDERTRGGSARIARAGGVRMGWHESWEGRFIDLISWNYNRESSEVT
ncbi:hypothetical protein C8J56DRAFT_890825 [Mycena floridula]|nr:hypothetical protein C8J56DRAFT_890825 [Mycena floridula]